MSPAHRKLLLGQAALGFLLNIPLNGVAALAGFPPVATLPVFARGNCVAGDTVGTSFFLPLTTCLILTPFLRRALRNGAVAPLTREALPRLVRWLPVNLVGRGALVGLLSALTAAPAACALLAGLGISEMTKVEDAIYKAAYTAILGMVVTPLLGLRALGDGEPPR